MYKKKLGQEGHYDEYLVLNPSDNKWKFTSNYAGNTGAIYENFNSDSLCPEDTSQWKFGASGRFTYDSGIAVFETCPKKSGTCRGSNRHARRRTIGRLCRLLPFHTLQPCSRVDG